VPSEASTVPFVTSQPRPPPPTWPTPWGSTTGAPPMPWGTSRWWILAALTVNSTLAAGPEHLDVVDAVGISSSRITDAVGTPLTGGPPTPWWP
jgi:hypothetical protein